MNVESDIWENSPQKINGVLERLEATREKMDIEANIFVEATKQFISEWIQREIEMPVFSPENSFFPENLKSELKKPDESKSDFIDLSIKISDIVETNLNRDDYWIHRSARFQPDISRDYIEFQKEKIRRELTSSVRIILGCATEIFWKLEEGEPENKAWVNELGRRKYACFLRFSDEMTASLNRYFELLEELLILNYKLKEEMLKTDGKKA
jgi:hypothetical protein